MVSARVTASLLEAAPVALVAGLSAWAFWDFLGIPGSTFTRLFIAVLLAGLAALVLGLRFEAASLRRAGLALVALSYLGAHVLVLPLDPAEALAFVTLVLLALEIRILAERFAPILRADLTSGDRSRATEALARSVLRVGTATALAYFGSYLTADLALSGTLPLRTTATALVLSMALIAVVFLLAFWPLVDRRLRLPPDRIPRIQTPK